MKIALQQAQRNVLNPLLLETIKNANERSQYEYTNNKSHYYLLTPTTMIIVMRDVQRRHLIEHVANGTSESTVYGGHFLNYTARRVHRN